MPTIAQTSTTTTEETSGDTTQPQDKNTSTYLPAPTLSSATVEQQAGDTTPGLTLGPVWTQRLENSGTHPSDFFVAWRKVTYTPEEQKEMEARQHYFFGTHYLEVNEPVRALAEFRAALEQDPDNSQIRLQIAEAHVTAKQMDAAEQVLDELLKADPKNVRAMLFKAQVHLQRGEEEPARRKEMLQKATAMLEQARTVQPRNLDILKNIAQAYFAQQDIQKIIKAHKDILAVNPRDTYSLLILANVLSKTGQPQEAVEYYKRVIELRRGFINTYIYLAGLYEEMQRDGDALQTYKQGLLIEPRNEQLIARFDRLVQKLTKNRNKKAALSYYQRFAEEYPYSSEIQRLYADQLLAVKDFDAAIKQYRRVLELDSENVEAIVAIGNTLMQQKKSDEATKYFARAIEINPEKVEIYDAIAANLIDTKNTTQAAEVYERAIKLNPKVDRLYLSLAAVYDQMERQSDAVQILEKGMSHVGPKPEILVIMGQLYEKLKNPAKAIESYERAFADSPANFIIFSKLLSLYIESKQPDKVQEIVVKATAAAEDKKSEVLSVAGETYFNEGDLEQAASYYEQAVQSSPQKLAMVARLMQIYNVLKKHDASLALIAKTREVMKDNEDLARLEAEVYLDQKDYDKAIELYREMIKTKPATLDLYRLLADAQIKAERFDESLATVKSAEERIGNTEDVKQLRGVVLYQQKKYDAAERVFKELVQQKTPTGPKNADTYQYFLGSIYLEQKRYDMAEKAFRKAIEVNPNSDAALNALGYMFADRNIRLTEAKELLEKALHLNPLAPHVLDSMGWVYFRMGQLDKAKEYVEKAAKYMGEDAEVFEHLGDIYEAQGDLTNALKYWKLSLKLDEKRAAVKQKIRTHDK